MPDVNVGAVLSDVVGVISYDFGNFQVHATEAFSVMADSSLTAQLSNLTGSQDTLSVASYNVLNLDINETDGDTDIANGRFDAIAMHIVSNLNAPDIVALQEIQDNDGSEETSETSATVTLQALVDAISAAGGPVYSFADTPGLVANSVGGQPGGNIRVAFLYNTDRVSLSGNVVPLTDPLDQSSNENNPFYGSRISLAADFNFNGQIVTIINNHLSSKGGSAPIMGVEQPFEARQEDVSVNGSLDERQAQATAVRDFVAGLLALNADANIVVLGDMNEFEFISPVSVLLGAQLTNLVDSVDDVERYSFIFQGNSQQLDHLLVSDSLLDDAVFEVVHVNVEFAETNSRASDHEPLLALLKIVATVQAGDLNGDGVINRMDYLAFRRAFGSKEGHRRYNPDADFNDDGKINKKDLVAFLDLYWAALDSELPGDIDRDGDRDNRDRRLLIRSFGAPLSPRYRPEADLDRNYRVNRADLSAFDKL